MFWMVTGGLYYIFIPKTLLDMAWVPPFANFKVKIYNHLEKSPLFNKPHKCIMGWCALTNSGHYLPAKRSLDIRLSWVHSSHVFWGHVFFMYFMEWRKLLKQIKHIRLCDQTSMNHVSSSERYCSHVVTTWVINPAIPGPNDTIPRSRTSLSQSRCFPLLQTQRMWEEESLEYAIV